MKPSLSGGPVVVADSALGRGPLVTVATDLVWLMGDDPGWMETGYRDIRTTGR